MFTSWNHLDYLVRLDSQLALCLGTFWVLLRRHPATPTFNRLPGTLHYPRGPTINRASRPIGLNGRLPAQLACHLNGCRSEDFNYQNTLEPCPHEPSIHYWAYCHLAIKARHHQGQKSKVQLLIYWAPSTNIYGSWAKMKNIKIFIFFVSTHSGSFGGQIRSAEVIRGHSRSLKVIQGHSRSNYLQKVCEIWLFYMIYL